MNPFTTDHLIFLAVAIPMMALYKLRMSNLTNKQIVKGLGIGLGIVAAIVLPAGLITMMGWWPWVGIGFGMVGLSWWLSSTISDAVADGVRRGRQ